jgi:hypothetical protein
VTEIRDVLLAIAAFLPVAVCPGYLVSWFADLYRFRSRSFVERILWSIPASFAVSTIASVLIAWAFSLIVVVRVFEAGAALWLVLLVWESRKLRRNNANLIAGWQPLGGSAIVWAALWIAVAVLSLVDFEYHLQLFMSLTIYDQGARVSWTESIMRTGVPPANPYYWYQHASAMRNYYFWYVICSVVAILAHVSARTTLMASCVWSGFGLVALIGLYLKHFLGVTKKLRRHFVVAISLLMVSGLDIIVHLWNYIYWRIPIFSHPRAWFVGQIDSWFVTLLFAPHHVVSLVCCMFAFLLAWMGNEDGRGRLAPILTLMAFALASAFGLSLYVTLAFALVMLAWGLWELIFQRSFRSSMMLGAGGLGSGLLLIPYLRQLAGSSSGIHGTSPFGFSVRETVPSDRLLSSGLLQSIALSHPIAAKNLAKLLLLTPGLAVELGFLFGVFLLYLLPALRFRAQLTPARRTLIFITATSLIITSLIRSSVISYNDFGFRGALFMQFSLLLLASEVVMSWQGRDSKKKLAEDRSPAPAGAPYWLRSILALACVFGVLTTAYYGLMFRFTVPLVETAHKRVVHDPIAGNLSHDAYISSIGYAQLDAAIPRASIVQFNPSLPNEFWGLVNLVAINRQVAIAGDKPWCGSELGGDPTGCPAMASALDALFNDSTAEQAHSTCRQFGIQYLVTTIYDPVWKERRSWVWTLKPVVQDPEFRALDCR